MIRFAVPLFTLGLLTGCDQRADSDVATKAAIENSDSVTARFHTWIDEKHHEELRFTPMRKTFYGIKDEDYGRIGDVTENALDERLNWRANVTKELRANWDYEALNEEGKTTYDLWMYQTERGVAASEYRVNHFLFHHFSGVQQSYPRLLITFHDVASKEDAEAYISRIIGSAKALRQSIDRSRRYADRGVHMPYFSYDEAIRQADAMAIGAPFSTDAADQPDNPVWADFNDEIDDLVSTDVVSSEEGLALRESARAALIEHWQPAYQELVEWLRDDQANATAQAKGASSLLDGENYYQERLKAHTTTELTAEEIHELGLQRVSALRAEIESLAASIGFDGSFTEFLQLLRDSKDDERFYYPNTDAGRQGYIDDSTTHIENIKAQLPNFFGILPKADLIIKRVEPYREQPGAAQHYFASSPDGSRPGIYYAHLIDMFSMPKYELEAVAYHEALPGHHMQIAIANELTGLPEFRKRARATAYSEGWGLYAERLANEIPGTYADVYSQVGRLGAEIWRAVRLVVDTGLHAKGWSEGRAVDYMLENSLSTDGQARSEIRRYLVMPGQATAYMVGMLRILELRANAEERLGEHFDIREFHDVVLGGGAMPLNLLERRIETWLSNKVG